jgi:hypothetical protein
MFDSNTGLDKGDNWEKGTVFLNGTGCICFRFATALKLCIWIWESIFWRIFWKSQYNRMEIYDGTKRSVCCVAIFGIWNSKGRVERKQLWWRGNPMLMAANLRRCGGGDGNMARWQDGNRIMHAAN